MKTTFVSTPAIANAARLSLMRMQNEMVELNAELSSGRHADVGLEIGHHTGRTVSLRSEHASLAQYVDVNSLVMARLDTTQGALDAITQRSQDFINILVASRDGRIGRHAAPTDAKDALSFLTSQLNVSINGEFVFGGINSDVVPIAEYFTDTGSSAKAAVDAVFLATFGFSQDDPNVSSITATDMETFLDGAFDNLFVPAGWTASWSSASDTNVESRIAPGALIESGINANREPFRKLAMAFTMMADLGNERLNSGALGVVIDKAVTLASQANYDLALAQGEVGVTQQRILRANEVASVQLNILNNGIADLEAVDAYETTSRINELISQIEVSYAVTGRLQQLSLVRFL